MPISAFGSAWGKRADMNDYTAEDIIVIGKVLAVLEELHALPQDPRPEIRDCGPHRLYEWSGVLSRDDRPLQELKVRAYLSIINTVGRIKPQLYSIEDYDAELPNFTRYYITIYI